MNDSVEKSLKAYTMAGCCRGDRDYGGGIHHAVFGYADGRDASWGFDRALCGRIPGLRGNGWGSAAEPLEKVTCVRCLQKLAALDAKFSQRE